MAGRLKLEFSQFRELAAFAQFGSDLDAATQRQLNRGQRIQETLKQPQYEPLQLDKQVMNLFAVTNGYVNDIAITDVKRWELDLHAYMDANHPEIGQTILRTKDIPAESLDSLRLALETFNSSWSGSE